MADGTVSWFAGVDWGSERHHVCSARRCRVPRPCWTGGPRPCVSSTPCRRPAALARARLTRPAALARARPTRPAPTAQFAPWTLRSAERDFGCVVVVDSELHPQHFRAFGDCFARKSGHFPRFAETVDHVDRSGDGCNIGIALLAEHVGVVRVHGDDAIAVFLHVFGREIARPIPVGRQSDDGDHARARQDAP